MSDGAERARLFENETSAEHIVWQNSEVPIAHQVANIIAESLERHYPEYDDTIVTEADAHEAGASNCLVTAILCHRAVTRLGRLYLISGIGIDGYKSFHSYAVISDTGGYTALLDCADRFDVARVTTDMDGIVGRRSLVLDPLSKNQRTGLTWRAKCTGLDLPSDTTSEIIGCTPYRKSETLDKIVDSNDYELKEVIARGSTASDIFDDMQHALLLHRLGHAQPRPLIQDSWLRGFIKRRGSHN